MSGRLCLNPTKGNKMTGKYEDEYPWIVFRAVARKKRMTEAMSMEDL